MVLAHLGLLQTAVAQTHSKPLPAFEDYPVKDIFKGTPHPPIFTTPEQHRFRTRIREGVEKGWGVWVNGEWSKEQNRAGPNFAGHYIVVVWGCGAPCLTMVVCDAATGAVYSPPISARPGGLALPLLEPPGSAGGDAEVEYRLDSQLMIVKATPHVDRPDAASYTFYFLWRGDQWKLLRRVMLEN